MRRSCPTPPVSPRSSRCGRGSAIGARRGCPAPPVSPRSSRCRQGAAFQGWRGCTAPPVSPRSSRCCRDPDILGWRGCPTPPVSPRSSRWLWRSSPPRLERLPSSAGISPLKLVAVEVQHSQVGEAAQLRRYLPAQLVAVEDQRYNAPVVVGGDTVPFADGSVAQPVVACHLQFSPFVAL